MEGSPDADHHDRNVVPKTSMKKRPVQWDFNPQSWQSPVQPRTSPVNRIASVSDTYDLYKFRWIGGSGPEKIQKQRISNMTGTMTMRLTQSPKPPPEHHLIPIIIQ